MGLFFIVWDYRVMMENQMEKTMENEMDTREYRRIIEHIIFYFRCKKTTGFRARLELPPPAPLQLYHD